MPKVRTLTEKQRREQREQPASCGNDPSLCAARPEERARDEGQPGRVLRLCRGHVAGGGRRRELAGQARGQGAMTNEERLVLLKTRRQHISAGRRSPANVREGVSAVSSGNSCGAMRPGRRHRTTRHRLQGSGAGIRP